MLDLGNLLYGVVNVVIYTTLMASCLWLMDYAFTIRTMSFRYYLGVGLVVGTVFQLTKLLPEDWHKYGIWAMALAMALTLEPIRNRLQRPTSKADQDTLKQRVIDLLHGRGEVTLGFIESMLGVNSAEDARSVLQLEWALRSLYHERQIAIRYDLHRRFLFRLR